ncbi:FAD/NAD(P)-binding protein [Telmatospirillum siberiense]|uniref:FAD-dependent oxidoreductase n=1 Tax=Telmatospirillum siberiense TaxID=382514 RepID=A0A2N3PMP9_9PROT|nr:FAD/NAD(P)-binding protein [Telmatospirillum siberiense]PKU21678.1 FAD-dependent oxidoreductase [Telmatospirillum siberiense]
MPPPYPSFGIIGAGFSGSLLAVHLLRRLPCRIHLIERRPAFGQGLAYSTSDPGHLLNVRTSRMSAFEDDPDHFRRWLSRCDPEDGDPKAFVPRAVYGQYLQGILKEQLRRKRGYLSLNLIPDEAVGLTFGPSSASIALAGGRSLNVDAVVLAVGNFPPEASGALAGLRTSARYVADSWNRPRLDAIPPSESILVIGTGLSMIDCVLCLSRRGHQGPVLALSRHGLLPLRHADVGEPLPWTEDIAPPVRLSHLLRQVRRRAAESDWHALLDGMRPYLQQWWGCMSSEERRRFLRHLRPWWGVHRHRLAPQVDDWLAGMRDEGRLSIAAGQIVAAEERADGIEVVYRPRGGEQTRSVTVGTVINCSGPATDVARVSQPLLKTLLNDGLVRPDELRLGFDVAEDLRLLAADGRPNQRLFALGPVTRGRFWEVTAVPDIRRQAEELAAHLAACGFGAAGGATAVPPIFTSIASTAS